MAYELKYRPDGDVAKAFLKDWEFFTGIRGPVGSGKSVACCIKALLVAQNQKPDKQNKRRVRGCAVRNTNPQLKTTTIKTWLDWFPEDVFGKFSWSPPYTHNVNIGNIELEMIFLALDTPDDVKKLLSLELTFAWLNEAREIPKSIVDAVTMRVGRFPSMKDGGPTWSGVFADTNPPDEDHWWPILSGEAPVPDHIPADQARLLVKPPNWRFYTQPPAMLEVTNEKAQVTGYVMNPKGENHAYLKPDYYQQIIQGKLKSWIDVYVLNRLGSIHDGKPVYSMFSTAHRAQEQIQADPTKPLYIGLDFGLTPAAAICQRDVRGRWLLLDELVAQDMGLTRFAPLLKKFIFERYPDHAKSASILLQFWGDPSGDVRAQTDETTPFMILRRSGIMCRPAPSNDVQIRLEAVQLALERLIDGNPGVLVSPTCKTLIGGFEGNYKYKRLPVAGAERYEDKPDKNRFSHVHDALQYAFLGGGEGRAVTMGNNPAKVTVAKHSWDPFRRMTSPRDDRARRIRSILAP